MDNLFDCCWLEVLDRRQAAYRQLSEEQLETAIAIAEAMITQPDQYTQQLNQNSLRWRQKLSQAQV